MLGEKHLVPPQQTFTQKAMLYSGPELSKRLKKLAKGLDLTVDYGWLWVISNIIYGIMSYVNEYIGNWGWTIVLVTLMIKLALSKFSASSVRSGLIMKRLKPKMDQLKDLSFDPTEKPSRGAEDLFS